MEHKTRITAEHWSSLEEIARQYWSKQRYN